jgi:hypothetical protein
VTPEILLLAGASLKEVLKVAAEKPETVPPPKRDSKLPTCRPGRMSK